MNNLTVIEKGLIPIYENEKGEKLVDGRELHEFLEVGKDFTTWIKDRIEKYGFIENLDFALTLTKTGERLNVTRHDYILKLDMAKEIAMVENNSQGRAIRRYFIEVEKKFRQQAIDVSKLSPEMQLFKQIFDSVAKTQLEQQHLKNEVTSMRLEIATANDTIQDMKDAIVVESQDWRKDCIKKLRKIGFKHNDYKKFVEEAYKALEGRAGCDLSVRLNNLKARMALEGATKTAIDNANYLDVISIDKRLREIYVSIVNQMYVKYAK